MRKTMYEWVEKFWVSDARNIKKDVGHANLGRPTISCFNLILESEGLETLRS